MEQYTHQLVSNDLQNMLYGERQNYSSDYTNISGEEMGAVAGEQVTGREGGVTVGKGSILYKDMEREMMLLTDR